MQLTIDYELLTFIALIPLIIILGGGAIFMLIYNNKED